MIEDRRRAQEKLNLKATREDTQLLRTSAKPRWERLRERLRGEEISPNDAALTWNNSEDYHQYWGLILTRTGRLFEFYWDYSEEVTGLQSPTIDDAHITMFREIEGERKQDMVDHSGYGVAFLESEDPTKS